MSLNPHLAEVPQPPSEEPDAARLELHAGAEGSAALSAGLPESDVMTGTTGSAPDIAEQPLVQPSEKDGATQTSNYTTVRRTGGWALQKAYTETSSVFDDDIYKKRGGGGWVIREYMRKQRVREEHGPGCNCTDCLY